MAAANFSLFTLHFSLFFVPLHLDFKETNKNMDKNTIIGFVLIAVVLIGFSWYSQPSAEQIEAQRKEGKRHQETASRSRNP